MRILLSLVVLAAFSFSLRADPLQVGSAAPHVTAMDQNGQPVDFAKVYAKGVTLVYFYPKAGTAGCTAEACSLRDAYANLQAEGVQVIGVSRDTPEEQSKFQTKNKLPFTLVSDPKGKVSGAFGVPTITKGTVSLDARQSFLIKDDRIVWNSPHAQTAQSSQEVEKALAGLK